MDIKPDAHANYIDQLKKSAQSQRLSHERKWYDNDFFDDGYHFRYVSRTTGRILDTTKQGDKDMPMRAIPKASRQIRGVANLLLGPEYVPVVYPEEITPAAYTDDAQYQQSLQKTQKDAKVAGLWILDEWEQNALFMDMIDMVLMASKNSVSYIKIYPDYKKEKIKYCTRNAYELFLIGSFKKLEEVPFIVEAYPCSVDEILSNDQFEETARAGLLPDNKYASSEVRESYMRSRYGSKLGGEENPTVILNESWVKTYIKEDNREQIVRKAKDKDILKGKEDGDVVMMHSFTAGGQTLLFEYLDMDEYPYVDFRFEPGALYQVPFIDRFIPANKSLDVAMSRVEKYMNTMVTGVWLTRAGEDLEVSNIPGGQKVTYKATKPEQMQMASIPAFVFNYIDLLNNFIEEQGATTAALGQIPQGVKSGVAIESLKSTEYANLKIPSEQLKDTIRRIANKMITIGSDFIYAQEFTRKEKDVFNKYSVIGSRGAEKRMELDIPLNPEATVISKSLKVDIEVESGLGFTMEGKKETMQQITQYIMMLADKGLITQEQVQTITRKFLETYQFGATQEFMDGLSGGTQASQLNEDQLTQMKVAIAEVIKDLGLAGEGVEEQQIQTTKIGVVEALKDTGMLNKPKEQPQDKGPSKSISFKDLPPEGKVQLAEQAGISITPDETEDYQESQKPVIKENK